MTNIKINNEICIKCGKCSKVCPSKIMIQKGLAEQIDLDFSNHCIGCGHCVDVCPVHAINHSIFPIEKIHKIDYAQMPSPDQVLCLLQARRSNRALSDKEVPKELIQQIVEAANLAPTASNAQLLSYTVISDAENLRKVSDFTINIFNSLVNILTNTIIKLILKPFMKGIYSYVSKFKAMAQEHYSGADPILRNAKALILIHTPKSNRFGAEDANLAYQNGSLMAQALGVSQIYMGFVLTALRRDKKNKLARSLGINGEIKAIMALGMPEFSYTNYSDRKDLKVNYL